MDSYYETQKLYKHYLPGVLSFDEFKSVKSADGAMSFHMCDGTVGQTIDIVEDRRLDKLLKYVSYYDYKTRIMIMKKYKTHHRKFKRYWRLILKDRNELDFSKWKKFTCFNSLMTESDVVDYLINLDDKLKQTYLVYQDILYTLKIKNYQLLKAALSNYPSNIPDYMKTSIKTLTELLPFIKNTFNNSYHNGYIEGNNNFIKVIKRIAFGFRSFTRFKARIMICKGLLKIKKIANA